MVIILVSSQFALLNKLPIRRTSDEDKKNQMDGYDTNVLVVVSFRKSQYALNSRAEILSLLQTMAEWLHVHTYSNSSTKSMRQENGTVYGKSTDVYYH